MMSQWSLDRLTQDLPDITARVDLIVADGDKAVPPTSSKDAARLLPDAHVHTIKTLGHLAHEEDPDQVLEIIERILQAA